MLVDTKELIEKVKKHKIYLFYASGIFVICINIVIIYFLIKLVCVRVNEIIPMIRILLGNPAPAIRSINRFLYRLTELQLILRV